MACGGCGRNIKPKRPGGNLPQNYDLAGGVNINSLTDRQINARLEVFKRKFCTSCNYRYKCNYGTYLDCKGMNPK